MRLTSPAFGDGSAIPSRYTKDGANHSPPIRWHDVPQKAAELLLIVEDVDAPREDPAVHWVVYKIPADSEGLPAGVPPNEHLTTPPGSLQGLTDFPNHRVGYNGPSPARGHGAHHYRFRLLAIDEPLHLDAGESRDALLRAIEGHVVGEACFTGRYERQ